MPGNTETIRQLKSSFDAGEHVEFDERVGYGTCSLCVLALVCGVDMF